MALTLEEMQRLQKVSLVAFYEKRSAPWDVLAKKSHDFAKESFPKGQDIRVDDVAKVLMPLLEVAEDLQKELASKRLVQKYWKRFFANLVLDKAKDKPGWNK